MGLEETIEFRFIEQEFDDEEHEKAMWPTVTVDTSQTENVYIRSLVQKILWLAYAKSIEEGAEYNLDMR